MVFRYSYSVAFSLCLSHGVCLYFVLKNPKNCEYEHKRNRYYFILRKSKPKEFDKLTNIQLEYQYKELKRSIELQD